MVLSRQLVSQRQYITVPFHFEQYTFIIVLLSRGQIQTIVISQTQSTSCRTRHGRTENKQLLVSEQPLRNNKYYKYYTILYWNTYSGKLFNILVSCSKWSDTDLLWELCKTWVQQHGYMSQQLMHAISAMRLIEWVEWLAVKRQFGLGRNRSFDDPVLLQVVISLGRNNWFINQIFYFILSIPTMYVDGPPVNSKVKILRNRWSTCNRYTCRLQDWSLPDFSCNASQFTSFVDWLFGQLLGLLLWWLNGLICTYGSTVWSGREGWRMYCVHWNTLKARLARKSLADNNPATGRKHQPVFSKSILYHCSISVV